MFDPSTVRQTLGQLVSGPGSHAVHCKCIGYETAWWLPRRFDSVPGHQFGSLLDNDLASFAGSRSEWIRSDTSLARQSQWQCRSA